MIRWGVAGPGGIATDFAEAMQLVDGGEIVAVASRSSERADAFGDRFGIATRYGDYAALADDPDVDVVYVATPQSRHEVDAVLYLKAGKHVLCEKPCALNARQVQRMVDEARRGGLFLMEAVWSRFLPAYRALVDVVGSGRVGELLLVEADFGFSLPFDPDHRLYRADLGGGGLLDLGIYPFQLCALLLGHPEHVVAEGIIGQTGVDEQVAAVLRHRAGALGVVKAGITVGMSCTARIAGSQGVVEIPAFMHCPTSITVRSRGGVEEIEAPWEHGLRFEIDEVHRCLAAGLTESPLMTLDESLGLAATLDEIRAQIGLRFPGE